MGKRFSSITGPKIFLHTWSSLKPLITFHPVPIPKVAQLTLHVPEAFTSGTPAYVSPISFSAPWRLNAISLHIASHMFFIINAMPLS